MKIYGLQKMTLLDFPGHVACTVFLGFCDFRCPFCHNFELVDGTCPPLMDETELYRFLEKRKGLLDGVAVTGGEPMLNGGLPELLKTVRQMGFKTKVDTNGCHPEMLKKLLDGGLIDYVAMDVKNSRDKYALTAGVARVDLSAIDRSIRLIEDSDIAAEFRTTVIEGHHDEADIRAIGQWLRARKPIYLQPFTDRDTVPVRGLRAPDRETLRRFLAILTECGQKAYLRGEDS